MCLHLWETASYFATTSLTFKTWITMRSLSILFHWLQVVGDFHSNLIIHLQDIWVLQHTQWWQYPSIFYWQFKTLTQLDSKSKDCGAGSLDHLGTWPVGILDQTQSFNWWTPEIPPPPKINIEPENDGLVQMIFLFQGLYFSGSMLIFRGVWNISLVKLWLIPLTSEL